IGFNLSITVLFFSVLLIFFLYASADHRALHSFPTRRSSDLPGADAAGEEQSGSQERKCQTTRNAGRGTRKQEKSPLARWHPFRGARSVLRVPKTTKRSRFFPKSARRSLHEPESIFRALRPGWSSRDLRAGSEAARPGQRRCWS